MLLSLPVLFTGSRLIIFSLKHGEIFREKASSEKEKENERESPFVSRGIPRGKKERNARSNSASSKKKDTTELTNKTGKNTYNEGDDENSK